MCRPLTRGFLLQSETALRPCYILLMYSRAHARCLCWDPDPLHASTQSTLFAPAAQHRHGTNQWHAIKGMASMVLGMIMEDTTLERLARTHPQPGSVTITCCCRLALVRGSRLWRQGVPSWIITEMWSDPGKLTRQVHTPHRSRNGVSLWSMLLLTATCKCVCQLSVLV